MELVILLSLVTASVAYTITEAVIFAPLRVYMSGLHDKLGELFSCGYCMSHWVAFFFTAVYQPRLFYSSLALLDYFATAIFIVWLAAAQWRLMQLSVQALGYLDIRRQAERMKMLED